MLQRIGKSGGIFGIAVGAVICASAFASAVAADRFNSTNYTIDASVSNSFGGATSSTSYKMESSGGEAVIGNGQAGSYKLGQGYIAQLEKTLQLNVQPEHLLVHYPMEEPVGTRLYDNTAGVIHSSLVGSPVRGAGKIGQAVAFDGVNHYSTAGGQRTLDIDPSEAKTFSVWMKTGALPAADSHILWQNGDCKGWFLQMLTTGHLKFTFSSSDTGCTSPTYYTATAATNYADNAWHHVVATVDRSTGEIHLYVDGVLKGSTTGVDNAKSGSGGDFIVGAKWDFNDKFNGTLDEVMVLSTAYSDKAVTQLFNTQNSGVRSALIFPPLLAGTSKSVSAKAIIQTDAPGYSLALSQNNDLTSGVNTIPAITGTISTPEAWSEGTTKGLGFTLTAGANVPAKWGTSPNFNYAATPSATTSFYSRTGYTGGIKDALTIQSRVDITTAQPFGDYKNTVTYSATITP